ncbi:MAG: T9SS type A sorting domain-containing protein [Bacteroidota bacterium]
MSSLELSAQRDIDGLYVDNTGTLYAAGTFRGFSVFKIEGNGDVSNAANGFSGPIHMTRSTDGNLYVTNFNSASVSQVNQDGMVSTFASVLDGPSGIVSDADGNLYVSHYGTGNGTGNSVSKIAPDGTVSTFAMGGTLRAPVGIAIDPAGNIYTANLFDGRVTKITPDGTASLFGEVAAAQPFAIGHLVWAKDKLYGTYVGQSSVIAFDSTGTSSVVAGTGTAGLNDGPASNATFTSPNGLAASPSGDTLYVAQGLGATAKIRLVLLSTATNIEEDASLETGALLQNYPNPFQNSTHIRYTMDTPAHVKLSVYDVLGREIKTLVDSQQAAGTHEVAWHAEDRAKGLYFYRLEAAGKTEVRSMLLQ